MMRRRTDGTIIDHLSELRNRLLLTLSVFVLLTVAAYLFRDRLSDWITAPLAAGELIFIAPTEFFLSQLRVAATAALLVVLPLLLLQLWAFVRPGLTRGEARSARGYLLAAPPLFYAGLSFAFYVMVPLVLRFLLTQPTGEVAPQISYGNYVGFVFSLCTAFGIAFQLPVVVVTLTSLEILGPDTLRRSRGVVVIAVLLLSALLTPPDIVSMLILAGPLLALFEASLLIARVRHNRVRRAN
jgi:sec-independent protein translocase protein TatC